MQRYQGRLLEWFDDKGYGFIQPNDPAQARVFLHIKDFAKTGPRPIAGCALEYGVLLDGQGRYRAQQVTYLKAKQVNVKISSFKQNGQQHKLSPRQLQPMQITILTYGILLVVLTLVGMLNHLVLALIMLVNIITYWCYLRDKQAAKNAAQRVPELTLHILAVLGGWPAAWLAQEKLRHKTQKQPFRTIYLVTMALNILLLLGFGVAITL